MSIFDKNYNYTAISAKQCKDSADLEKINEIIIIIIIRYLVW